MSAPGPTSTPPRPVPAASPPAPYPIQVTSADPSDEAPEKIPKWAIGVAWFLLVAAVGALWVNNQSQIAALDAARQRLEIRANESDVARARSDELSAARARELAEARADIKALSAQMAIGFESLHAQIAELRLRRP